jgi:hypothetical protein
VYDTRFAFNQENETMESIRLGIISALVVAAITLFAFDVKAQAPGELMSFGYPNAKAEFCMEHFGIFTEEEMAKGHEWLVAKAIKDFNVTREAIEIEMRAGAALVEDFLQKEPSRLNEDICRFLHDSFVENVMNQSAAPSETNSTILVDGEPIDPTLLGKPQAMAMTCGELYGTFNEDDLDKSFEWLVALGMEKMRIPRQAVIQYMFAGFSQYRAHLNDNPPTEKLCQRQHQDFVKMVKGAVSL